jgi:hypothetical protein
MSRWRGSIRGLAGRSKRERASPVLRHSWFGHLRSRASYCAGRGCWCNRNQRLPCDDSSVLHRRTTIERNLTSYPAADICKTVSRLPVTMPTGIGEHPLWTLNQSSMNSKQNENGWTKPLQPFREARNVLAGRKIRSQPRTAGGAHVGFQQQPVERFQWRRRHAGQKPRRQGEKSCNRTGHPLLRGWP